MHIKKFRSEDWRSLCSVLSVIIGTILLTASLSDDLLANKNSSPLLEATKTNIDVHYKARIDVSDSIIVFGTGFNTGVSYIKPGETAATAIPNSNNYSSKFFVAIGTKIVLGKADFTTAVYDTATGKMTEIPESKLRLRNINGSAFLGGSIQKGGNYAAVITDTTGNDKSGIKVIDISGTQPKIVSFKDSGLTEKGMMLYKHVAIDKKTGLVAGAGSNRYEIRVYDTKDPDKSPKVFNLDQYKGVSKSQMVFDNGKILFQTGETKEKAVILDVTTGEFTDFDQAINAMAMAGGKFVYFSNRNAGDKHGITSRAVVGSVGSKPKFSTGKKPIARTANNGLIGFGSTAAITPDGKQIFIAGLDDIGRTERFQRYSRGRFRAQRDKSQKPAFLYASDLVASSRILAFKTGSNNQTKLGYIKLK